MAGRISRRGLLGAAGAAALFLTAGQASGDRANARPPGGITIRHAFGETFVAAPPTRVVSAGWTEQDDLLAVGIVPIATTKFFGDQPFNVWPWAQAKLGRAQPAELSLFDGGIQVDRIAALNPDLIVAINAGVDAEMYQRLSAIAPTIPQSGAAPFFEPWKDQATTIGQLAFKPAEMAAMIAGVDDGFLNAGKNNPGFRGKKALLLQGTTYFENSVAASMPGWRTEFLTQMGFVTPDTINAFARDDRALIPVDQIGPVLDAADVLIWCTDDDADRATLLADPNIAALQATRQNRNVFTSGELAGAIKFASVLSYPVVAQQLPPMLASALR